MNQWFCSLETVHLLQEENGLDGKFLKLSITMAEKNTGESREKSNLFIHNTPPNHGSVSYTHLTLPTKLSV